ncbi:MAG: acylneuraminate cytidylyltransferase family protein [Actinobacteria bacterium]|nr:acylneuraminate cytidylyltransferase family protein [Actinomycetota bacterium]
MGQARCVCIIPARGGSKGIRRKNLVPLLGVPLISRIVRVAQAAHSIEQVVVSTDDTEIASEAERSGAHVLLRPLELSTDEASSESVVLHALDQLERENEYLPELTAFVQCTTPLTKSEDIDGTIKILLDEQADSAFTVSPFSGFVWRQSEMGRWIGMNHRVTVRQRRQDREPEFLETGGVYVFKTKGFRQHKHRFFGTIAAYVVEPSQALEIDDSWQLVPAEALLRWREREEGQPRDG